MKIIQRKNVKRKTTNLSPQRWTETKVNLSSQGGQNKDKLLHHLRAKQPACASKPFQSSGNERKSDGSLIAAVLKSADEAQVCSSAPPLTLQFLSGARGKEKDWATTREGGKNRITCNHTNPDTLLLCKHLPGTLCKDPIATPLLCFQDKLFFLCRIIFSWSIFPLKDFPSQTCICASVSCVPACSWQLHELCFRHSCRFATDCLPTQHRFTGATPPDQPPF